MYYGRRSPRSPLRDFEFFTGRQWKFFNHVLITNDQNDEEKNDVVRELLPTVTLLNHEKPIDRLMKCMASLGLSSFSAARMIGNLIQFLSSGYAECAG